MHTQNTLQFNAPLAQVSQQVQPQGQSRHLAIIGTAGRDRSQPLTRELWLAMTTDLRQRISPADTLISGGAAWADHLAVHAYLQGWCKALKLYLPAPFQVTEFLGSRSSSASAANYYHQLFKQATGVHGFKDIHEAILKGAEMSFEPAMPGYGGMFARNKKVALAATAVIAYTFGEGAHPADGGTMDTWKQIKSSDRTHVPLMELLLEHQWANHCPVERSYLPPPPAEINI